MEKILDFCIIIFCFYIGLIYVPLRFIILPSFIASKCNEYMTPRYRDTQDGIIYHIALLRILQVLNVMPEETECLGKMPNYLSAILFAIIFSEVGAFALIFLGSKLLLDK